MKRIGILAQRNASGGIDIPQAYVNFAAIFGMPIPIFTYDDQVQNIDLLIIVGGADVDPARYNQRPVLQSGNPNIQLEDWDKYMLPEYIKSEIPLFGICRGFQTLNVHFGGSLEQHIHQEYSESRDKKVHDVIPTTHFNSFITHHDIKYTNGSKGFMVNSLHHQGLYLNNLGKKVVPLLTHSMHFNIEAFHINNNIVAVQWHPEEIYDAFSINVIKSLLK